MLDEVTGENERSIFKTIMIVIFFVIIFAALITYGVFSSGSVWSQCSICGVQEVERKVFGFTLEAFSERLNDEFGSYEMWKKVNNKNVCIHDFQEVNDETLVTRFEALQK